MRKVNIPEFRKEVLSLIEANRKKVTSVQSEKDGSKITFNGKMYTCEITLNDKWVGYTLDIKAPKGSEGCGMRNDTDIYPIYGGKYEEIALEIYDDLLDTVKAIFSSRIYYSTNNRFSYMAKENGDGTYIVHYWERKKFLFLSYSSGWKNEEYKRADFQKLKLKTLS